MTSYGSLLRWIIQDVRVTLSQISPTEYNQKDDPSKWSKKELLGHLIDSAYNNHHRFLRAESQDGLNFCGYEQDKWVQLNDYQSRPYHDLISLWSSVNLHLASLIDNLPDEVVSRSTVDHNFDKIGMNRPEPGKKSSLSYLIWDYIFHLEHHLAQLIPDYDHQLKDFVHYK